MMKKTILILSIVLLVILIILGGKLILTWNTPYYESKETTKFERVNLNGTIEGSLSYPSEMIPPMEVCAENPFTEEEYCTYEAIKGNDYDYGTGYRIDVPEGDYFVFARLQDAEEVGFEDEDYKAYYSQFVTCGMEFECESHEPIKVEVKAGETVKDIDPRDWYMGL